MAYGEYGEQSSFEDQGGQYQDFFSQMSGPNSPAGSGGGGGFDLSGSLQQNFEGSSIMGQAVGAGGDPGRGNILGGSNQPQVSPMNFSEQIWRTAFGDLKTTAEAEQQRQGSYMSAIDTALSSFDRVLMDQQNMMSRMEEGGEEAQALMQNAFESARGNKTGRLEDYLSQVMNYGSGVGKQAEELRNYAQDMASRGEVAKEQSFALGREHIANVEKYTKRQQRKVDRYSSQAESFVEKQVATAEKANNEFKVNTASAAASAMAGNQANLEAQRQVIEMDSNLSPAQRNSMISQAMSEWRASTQGLGAQVVNQQAMLDQTSDYQLAATYGSASKSYGEISQISTSANLGLANTMANAMNTASGLFTQGIEQQRRYDEMGLAATTQASKMITDAAAISLEANKAGLQISNQIDSEYERGMTGLANMMSSIGNQNANAYLQSQSMLMEGESQIANLYRNQTFNTVSAMDGVMAAVNMAMSMNLAGYNPDQINAQPLANFWNGTPMTYSNFYGMPDGFESQNVYGLEARMSDQYNPEGFQQGAPQGLPA